jgi:type IV pilus assembly protein PilA
MPEDVPVPTTTKEQRAVKSLRNKQGFTLIELLIVVVIIGILAAIAIPRFASTKGKAFDAAAKTDLRNAMTAQEAYYSDNQTYASSASALTTGGYYDGSTNVTLAVASGSGSTYEMTAKHSDSSNTWCVDATVGEIVKGTTC